MKKTTKNKIIFIAFLISFTIMGLIGRSKVVSYFQNASAPTHRIAFITALDTPLMKPIKDGITDVLTHKHISFSCTSFFHEQDKIKLHNQLEAILNSSPAYDAIIAVGGMASMLSHSMIQKRQSSIPLIMMSIAQPVEMGVAQTEEYTGYNSTGIFIKSFLSNKKQVEGFLALRPHAQKAAIIYTQGALYLEAQKENLKQALEKQGVMVESIGIETISDINTTVKERLFKNHYDLLCILRDHTTIAAVPLLKKLCTATGTTLCASDLYSVHQGAAVGYGIDDKEMGVIVGDMLVDILYNKVPAHLIPLVAIDESALCRLSINALELKDQGITLPLKKIVTAFTPSQLIIPVST